MSDFRIVHRPHGIRHTSQLFNYDSENKDTIWLEMFLAYGEAIAKNEKFFNFGTGLLTFDISKDFPQNFNDTTIEIYTIREWIRL